MKLRLHLGLRALLVTTAAALFIGLGTVGCKSSDEDGEAAPEVAEGEATAGENGEGNAAKAEGGAEQGNAAGGELQNLVANGATNAAATNPSATGTEGAPAGSDPFAPAAPAPNSAQAAAAAPAGGDPFAPAAPPPAAAEPAPSAPATAAAGQVAAPAAAPVASGEGVVPAGGVLPEQGAKMAYYVQTGDTLSKIAGKIYGSQGKWRELASSNNLKDPSLIYAGDVIYYTLTEKAAPFAEKYESSPRHTITVQKGDTLSRLAGKVLGSQGSWRTLWKANPQVKNPDVLKVGMVLVYREGAKVASAKDELGENEVLVGMAD